MSEIPKTPDELAEQVRIRCDWKGPDGTYPHEGKVPEWIESIADAVRPLYERLKQAENLMRETSWYALGSDCTTKLLKERIYTFLNESPGGESYGE